MTEHFVNLKCQNCGAGLEVYDDMERFYCAYCGSEMIVHRRGGTVALKTVAEAIGKVQIGTDRTAAELAIVRLQADLNKLQASRNKLQESQNKSDGCLSVGFICLAIEGVIATRAAAGIVAWNDNVVWFLFLSIFGGVLIIGGLIARWTKELADMDAQIRVVQGHIERNKEIVEA